MSDYCRVRIESGYRIWEFELRDAENVETEFGEQIEILIIIARGLVVL